LAVVPDVVAELVTVVEDAVAVLADADKDEACTDGDTAIGLAGRGVSEAD
jgi:hypothetical protein